MKRGEIWAVAGEGDYLGRPGPVVILQDDRFDATESITICGLTSDATEVPLVRVLVVPNERNGLDTPSRIMADKITTVRKARLGMRIGRLDEEDEVRLNQAVLVFLGFA